MEANDKLLQQTREAKIPELIKKFEKLADDIFKAVGSPLPSFTNIVNEEGETKITAEQQLYSFIDVRNSALNTANSMLKKVNELELELYNPKALLKEEDDMPSAPINYAKQRASNKKQP